MVRPVIGSTGWGTALNDDLTQIEAKAQAAKAEVEGRLSDASLAAAYAPVGRSVRHPNKFVFLGDSIVRGGQVFTDPWVGTNYVGNSWPAYAALYSGGRIMLERNAGVGGNRTADMLARWATDVAPYITPGTVVHIASGTNDSYDQSVAVEPNYRANMLTMIGMAHAKGAVVTLNTVPPLTGGNATQRRIVHEYNHWLRETAGRYGCVLVDFYEAMVDKLTGNLSAAFDSGDGTHPWEGGRRALGQLYADTLAAHLTPVSSPLARAGDQQTNLVVNGMFQGDTDADGVANSWAVVAGGTPTGGSYSKSLAADPDGWGQRQTLALTGTTAGSLIIGQNIDSGFAVGDRLRAAVKISLTSDDTAGATTRARAGLMIGAFTAGGAANIGWTKCGVDMSCTDQTLVLELPPLPATVGRIAFRPYIERSSQNPSGTATTGTAVFSRAALVNLTAAQASPFAP